MVGGEEGAAAACGWRSGRRGRRVQGYIGQRAGWMGVNHRSIFLMEKGGGRVDGTWCVNITESPSFNDGACRCNAKQNASLFSPLESNSTHLSTQSLDPPRSPRALFPPCSPPVTTFIQAHSTQRTQPVATRQWPALPKIAAARDAVGRPGVLPRCHHPAKSTFGGARAPCDGWWCRLDALMPEGCQKVNFRPAGKRPAGHKPLPQAIAVGPSCIFG